MYANDYSQFLINFETTIFNKYNTDNPEATSATTEEVTEVALSIKTESEADNEVKNDEKRTQPDVRFRF